MFAKVRPASWLLIAGFLIVYTLTSVFANYVLFELTLIEDISTATDGLISGTLIAGIISFIVLYPLILFTIGNLRPIDIGLQRDKLVPAILAVLAMWVLTNLFLTIASLLITEDIAPAARWTERGILGMIGVLIGQVFGNSLVEELGMRGFLIPQLFLKQGRGTALSRIVVAICASAVLFALTHLPAIIERGWGIIELRSLIINGVFFGLLYVLSNNVLFCVGVHAVLFNTAWVLVEPEVRVSYMVYIAAVIVIVIWKRPFRFMNRSPRNAGYTEPLDHA